MDITWYGLSCFRLTERGRISIVTDPYDPEVGLPALNLKGDIVTVSYDSPRHNYTKAVKGKQREITGPGEYEIGGVFITGIRMQPEEGKKKSNTLYVFNYDGVTVAHLGEMASVPSQAQIENMGTVDVALVPVGGGGALSPSEAAEAISLIEPAIVIPMNFKTSQTGPKLRAVSGFLKEMGITKQEPLDILKVSKSGFPENTQVVVLDPAK